MAELYDIGDHMAKACDCGCVMFALLRSGKIECDKCREIQTNISWSDNMDNNYVPEEEKDDFSEEEIERGKKVIRSAISKNQQCFLHDIMKEKEGLPASLILESSKAMQRDKEIRLKEDSLEHAMEYILI